MKVSQVYNKNVNGILGQTTAICLLLCLTAFFTSCGIFHSIQHGQTTENVSILAPSPPPTFVRKGYNLAPFYQQWIDVDGLPVLASANVSPYALKEAAWLIREMLKHRQDILLALVHYEVRFVVIAYNEMTTQIPEYRKLKPNYYWDLRARGLGASLPNSIVTCGEENLLNYPGDPYRSQNILIHEFSHAIHLVGLNTVDPSFDDRLKKAFESAKKKGLWKGTYAITHREEYWAEGTQSWFNANWTNNTLHNHIKTREQLKKYDPELSALLTEVFGDSNWRYTKAKMRTHQSHLKGFNPSESPEFKWKSSFPNYADLHKKLLNPNSNGNSKWVNLKKLDLSQIKNLISKPNYTETSIIFVNRTEGDIAYYWVDYQGNEQFYRQVAANFTLSQVTHVGHYWIVKDMKGHNLAVFRAEKETGRAFVTTKP